MRKATQPANPPRIVYNDENNLVSSGAEENDDGQSSHDEGSNDFDDNDDETQSEKEWNLKEEITFEKICLTLLSEQNWNGLAIESKRHL